MLEDDLEKSHQDGERFRQTVARLRSIKKQVAAWSHHERTLNNPGVQAAMKHANVKTSRKRDPAAVSAGEQRRLDKKRAREAERLKNLETEQSKPKEQKIDAWEKAKQEYKDKNS